MFFCTICGNEYVKWEGKCSHCHEWGCIKEALVGIKFNKKNKKINDNKNIILANNIKEEELKKYSLHEKELKNIFSGGIYAGSSYLISGEPGIGKSTLLLHIIHQLNQKILYVCGEETLIQIKKRIIRTKNISNNLYLTEDTNILNIQKKLINKQFEIVIIDSLQTLYDPNISSVSGSINQMKYATQEIINFCRLNKIALLITGHINKSGEIAGPKLIEHLVDTSFFFYSTKSIGNIREIRVLSVLKNRFGPTEISSLFFMTQEGLKPLTEKTLSKKFFEEDTNSLNSHKTKSQIDLCGTCLFPHFIGKRLIFYEIECLIAPTKLSIPRRSVEGISISRLNRILAIMEKYCGLDFNNYDVFVQVTGGFKGDLLIDLSLIACIYSSLKNFPLPKKTIFLGEVGLSGKIKRVPDLKMRTDIIDSYGHFLYFSSHQDKNQVIVIKDVSSFFPCLEKSNLVI